MRVGLADPPYLGCGAKLYAKHHPEAAAFDSLDAHAALIARLSEDFDAWAFCLSSTSLRAILPLCPADVRVGAWVKPFCAFKVNVNPAYAWEPVIFRGGRKRGRDRRTVRDWVSCEITLKKGLPGAKPEAFCWWIFDFLGMEPEDELCDLFPGTGGVLRAWESYRRACGGFAFMAERTANS